MFSEFIKPSFPLIPGYTKLPPLDQVEGRFIVPPILVFRIDLPDAQDSIVQDLQDGLANTIEEMPFIAAHVVPDNKERGTIQLEIGDDAGVWFHVKELPELDFEALEKRQFAPAALSVTNLMPEPRQHDWDRSPVLTIQATFITGGLLVVTVTFIRSNHHFFLIAPQVFNSHHSVMDGRGMSIFGKTWGKNVSAVSQGRLVPEALKPESLDRTHAFGNGSCCMQLSEFPNYRISKRGLRSSRQRELLDAILAGDLSHPALQVLQQLHLSYWNIPQAALQAIKQAARPSVANAPVLTDSAIISALLWRHVTRARKLSSQGVESTCLVNVVNVCRRLEPPLPLDYPGNALAHAKTTAKSADVEAGMPLYELAKQVSESIDWWTSERIWGLIGAIDATPHVGKV
jgi:hypothetical protein